jgi:hypothetical protein
MSPKQRGAKRQAKTRRRHLCVTRLQDFMLSFVNHVRYTLPERPCQFPHHLRHALERQGGLAVTFEEILDQAIAAHSLAKHTSSFAIAYVCPDLPE